jgi:hypothetical protein
MPDFQLASILVDQLSAILLQDGLYDGQRAVALNYNNAELYWKNDTDKWRWPPFWQLVLRNHTASTISTGNVEQDVTPTLSLPALAPNDLIRISHFWSFGTGTNASKVIRVKIDSTVCFMTTKSVDTQRLVHVVNEVRNRGGAGVQLWVTEQTTTMSTGPHTIDLETSTTSKALGTAGKVLKLTGQNGNTSGSNTMTCECVDIWICGGT